MWDKETVTIALIIGITTSIHVVMPIYAILTHVFPH